MNSISQCTNDSYTSYNRDGCKNNGTSGHSKPTG